MFSVKSLNHDGASIVLVWTADSSKGNVIHRWGRLYFFRDLDCGVNAGTTGRNTLLGVTAAGLNGNVGRVGEDGDPGITGAVIRRLSNKTSDLSCKEFAPYFDDTCTSVGLCGEPNNNCCAIVPL